jgi:hypothetical protein
MSESSTTCTKGQAALILIQYPYQSDFTVTITLLRTVVEVGGSHLQEYESWSATWDE